VVNGRVEIFRIEWDRGWRAQFGCDYRVEKIVAEIARFLWAVLKEIKR
jgi:hypothetical protein